MLVVVYVIVWFGNNNSFFNASSTKSRATLSTKYATKRNVNTHTNPFHTCERLHILIIDQPVRQSINQSTVHSFIHLFSFGILHEPDVSVSISVPLLLHCYSFAHSLTKSAFIDFYLPLSYCSHTSTCHWTFTACMIHIDRLLKNS